MDQWVREQYKSKGGFGMNTLETRRSATVINRKDQRNTLLKKFRNIPETMSPLMSPMVAKVEKEKETVAKKSTVEAKSRRLNMLKKWKEEREKKKIEAKKKSKPVFKVFHVEHNQNLDDVYKNIKGKTINLKGKVAITPSIHPSENATMALRTHKESQNSPKKNANAMKGGTDTSRALFGGSEKPEKGKISKNESKRTVVKRKTTENLNRPARGQSKFENLAISQPYRSARLKLEAEPENKSESKDQQITTRRSERKNKDNALLKEDTTDPDEPKINFKSDDKENLLVINIDSPIVDSNNKKTPNRSRRKERMNEEKQEEILPSKISNKKKKRDKSLSQKTLNDSRKSSSTVCNGVELDLVDDVFATPKKKSEDEICYVSPFVTVSRGKAAARKEFEQRKSLNGSILNTSMSSATDPRSPKAAAAYFTRMVNNEINRIQDLCKIWQGYKDEGNISEDACGLIDMTIGQSNLLISKKFNQFRGLIEKCRANDEMGMKIQCEDLHGFWDMIYKQVTDLDKRFANLEDMKKNNWLEKAPKVKTPKKAVKKEKKRGRSKSTAASSGLKETILAARKFRMKQIQSEGDVEILIVGKNRTPRRISRNIKEGGTPGKGILKSTNVKSEKKKSVAFHNLMENLADSKGNTSSVSKGTPIPSRRSQRISLNRSKLVFNE